MQPKLKILDVFYGNMCNLTCTQCDVRSDIFRKGEYDKDLENIKEGIRLACEKFEIENYTLLGGEPLLYMDRIVELAKYIRSIAPNTVIMCPTNGALLSKNKEWCVELIEKYKVLLIVSDHFAQFEDKKLSNRVRQAAIEVQEKIQFPQLDAVDWFYEIFDFNNEKQDPLFQGWLDLLSITHEDVNYGLENDLFFLKEGHGLYYKQYGVFQKHHYIDEFGKPKPYNEGDPESSYKKGCCSPWCTYMHDKKLWKCGSLGTLHRFLSHHNSLDDPDWQMYLEYKPLDLETCTDEEVAQFNLDKYRSVKQCQMCPKNGDDFTKTPEMVLPNKRKINVQSI